MNMLVGRQVVPERTLHDQAVLLHVPIVSMRVIRHSNLAIAVGRDTDTAVPVAMRGAARVIRMNAARHDDGTYYAETRRTTKL